MTGLARLRNIFKGGIDAVIKLVRVGCCCLSWLRYFVDTDSSLELPSHRFAIPLVNLPSLFSPSVALRGGWIGG
jgi:hypothetical protein